MIRTIVRVVKTPLTLIALLALVGFAASWGWAATLAPVPPIPPKPCVTTSVGPALTPNLVTVRILNGGFSGGLAKRVGTELRSRDFTVIKINNTTRRLQSTIIVGRDKDDPAVKLVAGFFIDPAIEADGRQDGTVDVLLGATFPGYTKKPALSVPLADGTACLTAGTSLPTPSPSVTPTK